MPDIRYYAPFWETIFLSFTAFSALRPISPIVSCHCFYNGPYSRVEQGSFRRGRKILRELPLDALSRYWRSRRWWQWRPEQRLEPLPQFPWNHKCTYPPPAMIYPPARARTLHSAIGQHGGATGPGTTSPALIRYNPVYRIVIEDREDDIVIGDE